MEAIQSAGKRCPEDIAVIGFDGLAIGEFVKPRLSTVCQPATEMAAMAAQLLIDLIEHKRRARSPVVVPAKLLQRDSA